MTKENVAILLDIPLTVVDTWATDDDNQIVMPASELRRLIRVLVKENIQ